MSTALIGIGSNLGDRRESVRRAVALLSETPGASVVANSRLYSSKPVGGPHGQGDYVNAAAVLQTSLSPHDLLQVLQQVETQFGRTRSRRWAARTLDLDLLLFDDEITEDDDLTLPHPRMSFRRFVLEPAAEIAPEMVHPVTASRIDELLARLNHGPHYVAVGGTNREEQTWLAKNIGSTIDSPVVLGVIRVLHPTRWTIRLLAGGLEFYKLESGGLSRDLWNSSKRLRARLDADEEQSNLSPVLSNYWFEEWRFCSCLHGPVESSAPSDYRLLMKQLDELSRTIVPPKLVVWLNSSDTRSDEAQRWSSCLATLFRQSPCGPLLRLGTDDREQMLSESIAAIKAMEPLEGDVL